MKIILFFLIVIPASEIGILLFSGNILGVWPTILLIILTGVLGAYLAKRQGLETLQRAQEQIRYGAIPGEAMMDGICILIGAILLLTPGFITDTVGFILLVPSTRNRIKPLLTKLIRKMIDHRTVTIIK